MILSGWRAAVGSGAYEGRVEADRHERHRQRRVECQQLAHVVLVARKDPVPSPIVGRLESPHASRVGAQERTAQPARDLRPRVHVDVPGVHHAEHRGQALELAQQTGELPRADVDDIRTEGLELLAQRPAESAREPFRTQRATERHRLGQVARVTGAARALVVDDPQVALDRRRQGLVAVAVADQAHVVAPAELPDETGRAVAGNRCRWAAAAHRRRTSGCASRAPSSDLRAMLDAAEGARLLALRLARARRDWPKEQAFPRCHPRARQRGSRPRFSCRGPTRRTHNGAQCWSPAPGASSATTSSPT